MTDNPGGLAEIHCILTCDNAAALLGTIGEPLILNGITMLTNTDITNLIATTNFIANYDPARIEPASYDMVIGTVFRKGEIINSSHRKANDPIEIAPGEVVTMLTLEELHLPSDVGATAHAMNAQSSEGLLVLNPGHVDPGYKGPLTVVALNLRKVPLALQLNEKIFTVVFEKLDKSSDPPYRSSSWRRADFERSTNKKVVEKSIGSLAQLLSITENDIRGIIRGHWMSWIVMASSVTGMVAAIIAAVFAVIAVFPDLASKLDDRTASREVRITAETKATTPPNQPIRSPQSVTSPLRSIQQSKE